MFKRMVLIVAALAGATALVGTQQSSAPPAAEGETATAWVCPMHSDYTADAEGKCPRCGMALVHAAPFDVRDYRLDFTTVPAVVKPGQN